MAKGKVYYNFGMNEFPSEEAPGNQRTLQGSDRRNLSHLFQVTRAAPRRYSSTTPVSWDGPARSSFFLRTEPLRTKITFRDPENSQHVKDQRKRNAGKWLG